MITYSRDRVIFSLCFQQLGVFYMVGRVKTARFSLFIRDAISSPNVKNRVSRLFSSVGAARAVSLAVLAASGCQTNTGPSRHGS